MINKECIFPKDHGVAKNTFGQMISPIELQKETVLYCFANQRWFLPTTLGHDLFLGPTTASPIHADVNIKCGLKRTHGLPIHSSQPRDKNAIDIRTQIVWLRFPHFTLTQTAYESGSALGN